MMTTATTTTTTTTTAVFEESPNVLSQLSLRGKVAIGNTTTLRNSGHR